MRGIITAREVIGNGAECRMQNGAMQALIVVEHDQLPIGLHYIFDSPIRAQLRQAYYVGVAEIT